MSKKDDGSGLEPITFKKLDKNLSLDLIDLSPANVRKSGAEVGIEELKGSIQRIGLIQPVIVVRKPDGRFDLIVGQRRFRAVKQLGWKDIPALIIGDVGDVSKSVVSLGENLHRRELPYNDTILICKTLFKQYEGSSSQKINSIAADLGLSRRLVIKYLGYDMVPTKVKAMVEEKKLKPKKAFEITAAFWPNEQKIEAVAERVGELTEGELERVLDIGSEKHSEPIEKVFQEAKKPPPQVQLLVTFPRELATQLQEEADHRKLTINELIIQSVQKFLSGAV